MGIENILAGEWHVGASNIDPWVNGTRRNPVFRFSVAQESPLIVTEEQVFTSKDGKERRTALTSRFADGEFISRGRRILGTMSRWSVCGVGPDGAIVVIRMTHERGGQDGLLVLVRSADAFGELRATIATNAGDYGVGPEDFASLTWLPVA